MVDYHPGVFNLIIDLYQLGPDNPVRFIIREFEERRRIPEDVLADYGARLLGYQTRRQQATRDILDAAMRVREGQLSRGEGGGALPASIDDLPALRPHIRSGNIEIAPASEEVIRASVASNGAAFRDWDRGVCVRGWKSSRGGPELLALLSTFSNLKRFKLKIDWESERDEEVVMRTVQTVVSTYHGLEELDVSGCRLTTDRLLEVLDGLRDARLIKRINVRGNFLRAGIIERLRSRLPDLEELEVEENEHPPTNVVVWHSPSRLHQLYSQAVLGRRAEYDRLMAMEDGDDPLVFAYQLLLLVFGDRRPEQDMVTIDRFVRKVDKDRLREGAVRGDPEAQNCLGVVLMNVDVRSEAAGQAYRWLRKAADLGFVDADLSLGLFNQTKSDEGAAIEHYERATRGGSAAACVRLMGLHGEKLVTRMRGLEGDALSAAILAQRDETIGNLRRAANMGHVVSQVQLAEAISGLDGHSMPTELRREMYQLLRRAADSGHEGAKQKLRELPPEPDAS